MDNSTSSGGKKNSLLYITLFIITSIIIILIAGAFFFNYSKMDQLTRSLSQVQNELQQVKEGKTEKKQDLVENINPETIARLALIKAYTNSFKASLNKADLDNLDRITLYIEGNPDVIITKNPNLPEDIKEALASIKLKTNALKNIAVATVKKQVDQATYTLNEKVTLTGPITFVEDDEIYGGSIFELTDTKTGNIYYLHFNEANSTSIKNTMLDEVVTVDIQVTSKVGEPLTFEVVSGPTLIKQSPTPQTTSTP